MDDKKLFYISALSAIFSYLLLLFIVVFYTNSQRTKLFDLASKVTVLELDLVTLPEKAKSKSISKTKVEKKSTKKAKKVVKKSTSKTSKRTANVKSLFGKVKIKAAKVKKRDVLNIKSSMTASRFKSKFEKEKKTKNINISQSLSKITNKKKAISSVKTNKNTDPYYSKIKTILDSRWQILQSDEEFIAIVKIVISNNGKFSYNFIQYSGNVNFDNHLEMFLDSQSEVKFPISPSGSKEIRFTFGTTN